MDRLARPNIKMFTDDTWLPDRTMGQREKFDEFFESLADDVKLVVIEIGCGESVPKIRKISQELVARKKEGNSCSSKSKGLENSRRACPTSTRRTRSRNKNRQGDHESRKF